MSASTGSERTTLTMVLLRLLSHQSGTTMGMIAIESNIAMNGRTLHIGKHSVTASVIISGQSWHRLQSGRPRDVDARGRTALNYGKEPPEVIAPARRCE